MNRRILLILKYLWEQSDETHTVSIVDIMNYLSENGVSATRKTVTKSINILLDLGIDIVKIRKTQNRYFVATRHFEAPEVKMLIDAVQSAKSITPKKSKELINKLFAFVAPDQTEVLKRHLYIDSRYKATNETIYIVVDNILKAIAENKRISFQYSDYCLSGNQIHQRGGKYYIVSPYDLIWSNNTYYLTAFQEKKGIVVKFRVDRIKNLEVLPQRRRRRPTDYSVSEFFNREFPMLNGSHCTVTLLCENAFMTSIVDRFGNDLKPQIIDSSHFQVTVKVELSGSFYGWVLASEGGIKIVSPPKAVNGFQSVIKHYLSK